MPVADVLLYIVTTELATGVLNVILCNTPADPLTTVVVGAAKTILVNDQPSTTTGHD